MTIKEKKARMLAVVQALKELYPTVVCALEYDGDPWRLLVMGRLSAQCTDARVNIVCRTLFAKYPTPEALACANLQELETIIKPCGLFRTKAINILDSAKMFVLDYHGVLPNTMEELLRFPGVGRKIANLLLGDIYHIPSIVTDTHCIRICGRLGAYPETLKDPYKIEKLLLTLIPPEEQSDFCHRIVMFGRAFCMARNPLCTQCPLADLSLCAHRKKNKS